MQSTGVANLLCDPMALQAEEASGSCQCSPKLLLVSRQCCQLTFHADRADRAPAGAKQAKCIYWYTPGCTLVLFTVSEMDIPVNCTRILLQWHILPGLYLEVVNGAVFLGVGKMRKQCRIAGKPGSCFNPSMSCSATPLARSCPCAAGHGLAAAESRTRPFTTGHHSALQVAPSKLGSSFR